MHLMKNIYLRDIYLLRRQNRSRDDTIRTQIRADGGEPLRWAVVRAKYEAGSSFDVEGTVLAGGSSRAAFPTKLLRKKQLPAHDMVVMHIVPTGVRAAVGGSLGDAMPVNMALSRLGALVVTHPNTCNGGPYNPIDPERMFYVEGFTLDEFASGNVLLEPIPANQIGVIIDQGSGDKWAIDLALNQVSALYADCGLHIAGVEITDEPVGGRAVVSRESGAMTGEVKNIETVFRAAEHLIAKGASAIAVFTFVDTPENYWTQYFGGDFPNPVGVVEANISRSLAFRFGLPSAHAPLLTKAEVDFLQSRGIVKNPAAAGDAAVPFYIGSVLRGLQQAPRPVSSRAIYKSEEALHFNSVSALICPASCMGGIPMMRAEDSGIPIIGVRQNKTVLEVSASSLGYYHALEVDSYLGAIGLLMLARGKGDFSSAALKELYRTYEKSLADYGRRACEEVGINPATLLRPIAPVV